MTHVIRNGAIFDGERLYRNHGVVLENGRVTALLPDSELPATDTLHDLRGGTLLPGYIDLQVNGGGGVLFNDSPDVDTLHRIGKAHRAFGTTGFLPTLISDDYAVMRRAIEAVDAAIGQGLPGVLGIHLEGPFLNPKRKGVHNEAHIRPLDEEGFQILTSLKRGRTLVTLAPEMCRTEDISRLVEAGVIVSAGHTDATYEQARAALTAGLVGFTHLYNAMSPLVGRSPGVVGAALEDENSWFGIIADGVHCHPAALRVAVKAKCRGGALLVTDAMPTVGTPGGGFVLQGKAVKADKQCLRTADGTLAGSNLDMHSAVGNAARFAGIDWFEAARMASLYPARALGLEAETGVIRAGARASLLALDTEGQPSCTWIDGEALAVRPQAASR